MTTFAHYPIDKVLPHPDNVRRVAKASNEMIDSVRAQGVLEPVILGPDTGDGVRYLIAGNVRHHAAVEAGLTSLPAVLRDDLATQAQQLEAMLVENLHRTDLTAVEEADAYEQLHLLGMDDPAIAASTGRSAKTVKARRRLVGLPESARTKLHEGQATLADAEALLGFADAPDLQDELADLLGRKDFAWILQTKRDMVKRRERNQQRIDEFTDLGAADATDVDAAWLLSRFNDPDLREASAHIHAECLGFRSYGLDSYSEPALVCMDPASHPDTTGAAAADAEQARRQEEWARQREEQAAATAERAAAVKVRVTHATAAILALLSAHKPTAAAIADLTRAFLPYNFTDSMIEEVVDSKTLAHALGIDVDVEDGTPWWQVYRAEVTGTATSLAEGGTTNELLTALAALLASLLENALTKPAEWSDDASDADRAMAGEAWRWLAGTGYQLSSVDEQIRDIATRGDLEDGAQ